MGAEKYKKVREGMISCILATDMAKHNEILNEFKALLPNFDYSNSAHVNQVRHCLLLLNEFKALLPNFVYSKCAHVNQVKVLFIFDNIEYTSRFLQIWQNIITLIKDVGSKSYPNPVLIVGKIQVV